MQVNVFGQPRLRASLRDLRSPRRVPKSSIEDDLKRLILMDNSCPEPDPAPPLPRTVSDESLCGRRRQRQNSGNSPNPAQFGADSAEFGANSGNFGANSGNSGNFGANSGNFGANSGNFGANSGDFGADLGQFGADSGNLGNLGQFPEAPPGGGRNTLPTRTDRHGTDGRKGPVARLDPGLIPLPDAAGLEWATLVSAARAYEVQRAVSLFSLADPALSPEPPPAPPPPPRGAPLPPLSSSPAPLDLPGKVSQLEAMLKQLHSDLEKEKQDKVFLQAEVANLRQNNRRLQQESNSAARQLRRMARIFSGASGHQEP